MRRIGLLALFLPLTLACGSPTAPGDERALLAHYRGVWHAAGITSYRFSLERICECVPESLGPVVVEVRKGEIEGRHYTTGAPVDPQFSELFTTVPGLFDLIESALDLPAAAVTTRYHRRLGYPEIIQIDWVAGSVGDEVSYRVTGFVALPAL
jgi:hypothetical protein